MPAAKYQKRMGGSQLAVVRGKQLNAAGEQMLRDILDSPAYGQLVNTGNFQGGFRTVGKNRFGAKFDKNQAFQYFRKY